jgi:chromatin segregation and condensation protein Rec8/ScpA/Scc1 (kleisin family)
MTEITREEASEIEVDLGDLSLFDLLGAFRGVLDRFEREHPLPLHLRGETFSVRDQFVRWLERLQGGRPGNLTDELSRVSCRAEAIAAFLAVLELAKLGVIRLHQNDDGSVLLYRTTREVREEEIEAIPT